MPQDTSKITKHERLMQSFRDLIQERANELKATDSSLAQRLADFRSDLMWKDIDVLRLNNDNIGTYIDGRDSLMKAELIGLAGILRGREIRAAVEERRRLALAGTQEDSAEEPGVKVIIREDVRLATIGVQFKEAVDVRLAELRREGKPDLADNIERVCISLAFKGADILKIDNENLNRYLLAGVRNPDIEAETKAELVYIANGLRLWYDAGRKRTVPGSLPGR
jgi:hypothetical protein